MLPSIFLLVFLSMGSGPILPADEDPLAINGEMKRFLEERIDFQASPRARLEQLVTLIFREKALDFSYQDVTRTAIETFEHRGGNCLSFTNMFVAMARYLGLEVRYREVETFPNWSRRGPVLLFSRHVNVVVLIGAKAYVIDLFPRILEREVGGRMVSDQRGLAHYFNNKAVDLLVRGEGLSAISYLEAALQTDPEAAFVWANLGVAQTQLEDYGEAEQSYRKAIRLDNGNLIAMGNLAELYEKTGRQAEAVRWFKRVEKFRNKNPYYHYALGEQAYHSGDFEESIRHYRAALKRNSREHRFHFALARSYVQRGRLEEAARHLEKARALAPDESARLRYSHKLDLLTSQSPDL